MERLSVDEMVDLHEELIDRIHARSTKTSDDAAFRNTLERRIEEMESGQVKGIDASEVLKRL